MRGSIVGLLLLTGLAALAGCASSGVFPAANLTTVELSQGNFRVVATDVVGEATAGYLFGFSFGMGPAMQTVAIARVDGEPNLYGIALRNLWQNFEQQHGAVATRRLALVNVRFDSEAMNLLVYTRPTVSIRADVVEFD